MESEEKIKSYNKIYFYLGIFDMLSWISGMVITLLVVFGIYNKNNINLSFLVLLIGILFISLALALICLGLKQKANFLKAHENIENLTKEIRALRSKIG